MKIPLKMQSNVNTYIPVSIQKVINRQESGILNSGSGVDKAAPAN